MALRCLLLALMLLPGSALQTRPWSRFRPIFAPLRPLKLPLPSSCPLPGAGQLAAPTAKLELEAATSGEDVPARRQFVDWLIKYRKWLILTALVAQNAGTALLTGAARTQGAVYSPAGISLMQEATKGPMVILMIMLFGGRLKEVKSTIKSAANPRSLAPLLIPAACYSAQNILYFVALANLNPAVYQLFTQSKTIFTAMFVVTLLNRTLVGRQWVGLLLLASGVGAVQVSQSAGKAVVGGNFLVGTAAVLVSSVLSGFANVYFERIVKKPKDETLWVRQLQLNFLTALCTLGEIARRGELSGVLSWSTYSGWTGLVWCIVATKGIGGLLVGGTVKYADNILKSFATAVAIGVTCAFSSPAITPAFGTGLGLVLASIYLYNPSLPLFGGKKEVANDSSPDQASAAAAPEAEAEPEQSEVGKPKA